ncbi:BspA family leucine-rich repeat surface protein [Treponema sp.]|uniref:BspA family leucine-rich repeat surface protein n=1 Tax=Treponema sp. TaxID=166 RepID=UPI0025F70A2F|nr:BspA family leucine-rich repeat surface protein [Treponema sp.]MBR4321243.1 BspA family leucine-rich repeat surface protein [Treponema sp.]
MKKFFFILTIIAASIFSACNDISTDDFQAENNGRAYLSVSMNDISRQMIKPRNMTEDDIVSVELLAKKTESSGEPELVKSWAADETASTNALAVMLNDTEKIPFETGTYDFTLKLYAKNKLWEGSFLSQEATITQEIKAGNNTLEFNTKFTGEDGFINIMLYWHELDNVGIKISGATGGLYSVNDDLSIGDLIEEIGMAVTYNPEYGPAYGETTYQQQVAAGKYYLVIKLGREGVETPDVWFELIEVVGGAYTEAEVEFENPNDYYTIEYKTPGQDGDWVDVAAADSKDESATRWLSDASPVYSRNGNTSVVPPSKITRPNEVKGEDNVVSKFEFVGWYRDADCIGDKVEIINAGDTNNSNNIVLYAKWKEIVGMSIDVTINDGDDSDIVVTNNAENLTDTTLIFTADEGYDSYTWKVDGEIYQDGISNKLICDMTDEATGVYDVVLLARKGEEYYSYLAQIEWTRKYKVTFQLVAAPDEITGEDLDPVYVAENAENKTITAPEVTPPYGWYLDEAFTIPFDFGETEITESITIYGCWQLGTTFYVAEDGVDEAGRGTYGRPLASIEGAVKLMTDDECDYTISVVGGVKGEQKIRSSSELGTGGLAKSITLKGGGELDGEQKTRVLSVSTNVPVIIQNLTITNGNAGDEFGGGLYVASGASVTFDEGVIISENTAKRGGGVDVDGTLIIEDVENVRITSNTTSGYGAGLYVSGLLDMRGGDIGANEFTDYTSNEAQGRSIYVCSPSGSVKISGSAIINNDVYLPSGTKLIVAGELTNSSSAPLATITPASYDSETQWVSVAADSDVNLSDAVARIAVTDEVITDGGNITGCNKYRLTEEGKLQALANIDDIVSQINNMTASGTISVSGYVEDEDGDSLISNISSALDNLYTQNSEIEVDLDLSGLENLTRLPTLAFFTNGSRGRHNLVSITLPEGVTEIGEYAFRDCGITSISLPKSLTEIEVNAFYDCPSLKTVTLAEGNSAFKKEGNILYTVDGTELVMYCDKTEEAELTIPATVTKIGSFAFQGSNVKSIAFEENSALTELGSDVFYGCSKLASISLPDTVSKVGGECIFNECTSLKTFKVPESLNELTYLFFGSCTSLESVELPAGLTTIENNVFSDCSALDFIYFWGTEEQKETLISNAGTGNDALTKATWVCNFDGTIPVIPITLNKGTEISAAIASLFTGITTDDTFAFTISTSKPSEASVYLDSGNKIPVWLDTETKRVYCYAGSEYTLVLNADSSEMFKGCSKLSSIDACAFDTSKVTDMRGMFAECSNLTSVDLSGFDTSSVTDMSCMFADCSKLTHLNLAVFDTSSVTNMSEMFRFCNALESLTFGLKFVTENVTDMSFMFQQCLELNSLNLSGFNTSSVTDMSCMFYQCKRLSALDVSKFDTSNVTDMSYMFGYCEMLTALNVSNFNTSKVTNMAYMFANCDWITSLDVSNFDFSALVEGETATSGHAHFMFSECTGLTSINLPSTGLTKLASYMFYKCTGLTSIVIPASVTTVESSAFHVCSSSLVINCLGASGSISFATSAYPNGVTVNYNYVVPIGSKSAPDAVGDIVFSDGSAEAYTEGMTLTDEQKSSAVAVIFYKGELCSSDSTTTRILGVGLKNSSSESTAGLKWAADDSYYSSNSESVSLYSTGCRFTGYSPSSCTPTDDRAFNGFDRQTSGDKEGVVNGSENFALLKTELGSNDDTDDVSSTTTVTLEVSKYPAHFYANTYGVRNGLTGDYASGWYLPSFAEMCMLMRQHETLESALTMLGDSLYGADPYGTRTDDDTENDTYNWYWTSSYTGSGFWAAYYNTAMGFNYNEYESMHVLAIRQF